MANPVLAKSKKYSKYKDGNTTTTQYQPTAGIVHAILVLEVVDTL